MSVESAEAIFSACPGCIYGNSDTERTSLELRRGGTYVDDPLADHVNYGRPKDIEGALLFVATPGNAGRFAVVAETPRSKNDLSVLNTKLSELDGSLRRCQTPAKKLLGLLKTCPPIDAARMRLLHPFWDGDSHVFTRKDRVRSSIVQVNIRERSQLV